jgi:hypothetical protein
MQVINNPPPDGGARMRRSSSAAGRSHSEVGVAGNPAPGIGAPTAIQNLPPEGIAGPGGNPAPGAAGASGAVRNPPLDIGSAAGTSPTGVTGKIENPPPALREQAAGPGFYAARPGGVPPNMQNPALGGAGSEQTTPTAPAHEESGTPKRRGSAGRGR